MGRPDVALPAVTAVLDAWPARGLPSAAELAGAEPPADTDRSQPQENSDRMAAERAFTATAGIAELIHELRTVPVRELAKGGVAAPDAKRLTASDRAGWLHEEMATLLDPATYRMDPELAWRRLKPRNPKRRQLAVLKEVAAWREREAQRRDVPRNRVVRDETIMDIAGHAPTSID